MGEDKRKTWTEEETQLVVSMYKSGYPYKDIAEKIGKDWKCVRSKIARLGLQKDKQHITEHKCAVCKDTEHERYYIWSGDGPWYGKILCGKHYNQMIKNNKIIDPTPSKHIKAKTWTDEEKDILSRLYSQRKSIAEISQVLPCHSSGSITSMAMNLGLTKKYIRSNNANFTAVYQDYDWCFDHYINQGMSAQDMAKEAGCSQRVIEKWCMDKYKLNNHTFRKLKHLNEIQKDICMYGRLGDGCIALFDNNESGVYIESHASNQKDYLFWKYNILKDICVNEPSHKEATIKTFKDKDYLCQDSYRMSTRKVNELADIFRIPKIDICHKISEFGISVYLLDDGSRNNCSWELCVASLSDDEKNALICGLQENIGVTAKLRKDNRYIGFSKDDSLKLDNIILNNIPNNLDIIKYKILDKRSEGVV